MAKKIALFYLVIGISWIGLSSWVLQFLCNYFQVSTQQQNWLESLKGYFFVVITALLLFAFLQRTLAKSKQNDLQFQRMFEDNPNPMWVFDAKTLQILAANQAMVEEYGFSKTELLQMSIKDIRPSSSVEALETRLREELPTYSKSGIWSHQRKNGELFYVRIYSSSTKYQGKPSRLVMAFDITPIILAEQENRVLNNRLAKKERYLRSLIDSQTTFLIRINTQGQYTFVNQAYCLKMNIEPNSIRGQSFTINSSPEDQDNFQKVIEACLRQPGTVFPIIFKKIDGHGKQIIMDWEFVAIKTANDKISEIQGMGRDVTEEVESGNKIKEYTLRINDILESITDGFYAIDKNWNFTYVNKEFERLLHSKREDILNTSVWEQFPESVSLQYYNEYHRAMQEQVKVHFDEYYPRFQAWFRVSAYPTTDGLTVYFQDITKEKKAQEKDFEDAQNLNALINNPSALIWSVNTKYELITANQPFLDQMVRNTGILPQKGDKVLYTQLQDDLVNKWIDLYQRAFSGEVFTLETSEETPDYRTTYYEISFNPIRDRDGRIMGTGCFSRDITETKLHQIKIQEQNEKLREIAWIQSHRVRVPVANILGLINAFNYNNLNDPFNREVLSNLHIVTNDLDLIIREIVNKTNEVQDNTSDNSNMRLMLGDRIDINPRVNN